MCLVKAKSQTLRPELDHQNWLFLRSYPTHAQATATTCFMILSPADSFLRKVQRFSQWMPPGGTDSTCDGGLQVLRLVMTHFQKSTPHTLNPLWFAYRQNWSTGNGVTAVICRVLSHQKPSIVVGACYSWSAAQKSPFLFLHNSQISIFLGSNFCSWVLEFLRHRPLDGQHVEHTNSKHWGRFCVL